MKFYNREKELAQLLETHRLVTEKGKSHFSVVTGRRRVGKSELIKHFIELYDIRSLYFFVSKKSSHSLLQEFTELFNSVSDNIGVFENWSQFIQALFRFAQETKTKIIFDEFQNFTYVDSSVFGEFQKHWDNVFQKGSLHIVVAGSVVTLMEKIFYSQKEPLYGRSTQKLNLEEFHLMTIKEILQENSGKHDLQKVLYLYSIFGGIPFYYRLLYEYALFEQSALDSVMQLVARKDAPLFHEGHELLIQEFGNSYGSYFSILEAVALNKRTFNKIKSHTGISESSLAEKLNKLEEYFKVIQKKSPDFSQKKNAFRYSIDNIFLSFWFKYVYSHMNYLNIGKEEFVRKKIQNEIRSLAGNVYERYCLEALLDQFETTSFGHYWDKEGEIDVVFDNKNQKTAYFFECKLSEKSISLHQIQKFKNTVSRIETLSERGHFLYFVTPEELSQKTKAVCEKEQVRYLVVR